MVISFVAFVVCFELPRHEIMFPVDQPVELACDGQIHAGRIVRLSTSSAEITLQSRLPCRLSGQPVQLLLDTIGWIDGTVVIKSNELRLHLRPTGIQHRQLVVRLFASSTDSVAVRASLRGAMAATITRVSRGG
jgi:cellulose synthase (UDP-forming)